MTEVLFKKAAYDYDTLRPIIFEMLDALGSDRIQKNWRVLIKPNLLLPAKPEKGIVTHPLIVRAVAEYVLNQGGRPRVSDSPALGTFERAIKEGGYRPALEDLPVELLPFRASIKKDSRMLGLNPDRLPTHRAAHALGLIDGPVDIRGDFFKLSDFQLPVLGPLTFGPKLFQGVIRKHMVQRPVVDPEKCRLCGECKTICPAKAIQLNKKPVAFEYDLCIRCYCCVEICPYGALRTEETLPGKLVRSLQKAWEGRQRK